MCWGADVLGAASSVVAVAELVVGAVALGRVGFAATAGGAAGVVLLGERSWPQVAELKEGGFDVCDRVGELGFGRHGRPSLSKCCALERFYSHISP